ncbi:hypothethical protein (plasmid) [Ralstonia solanacearum CMR15]|nr:hypothethical protein [Ralstonia solanacearum CMR15]
MPQTEMQPFRTHLEHAGSLTLMGDMLTVV